MNLFCRGLLSFFLFSVLYLTVSSQSAPQTEWTKLFEGTLPESVDAVERLNDTSFVVAVGLSDSLYIGNQGFVSQGYRDVLLCKFDLQGNLLESKQLKSTGVGKIFISQLSLSAHGDIYALGDFSSTTVEAGSWSQSFTEEGFFLGAFAPDFDVQQWVLTSELNEEEPQKVAVGQSDEVFILFGDLVRRHENELVRFDSDLQEMWNIKHRIYDFLLDSTMLYLSGIDKNQLGFEETLEDSPNSSFGLNAWVTAVELNGVPRYNWHTDFGGFTYYAPGNVMRTPEGISFGFHVNSKLLMEGNTVDLADDAYCFVQLDTALNLNDYRLIYPEDPWPSFGTKAVEFDNGDWVISDGYSGAYSISDVEYALDNYIGLLYVDDSTACLNAEVGKKKLVFHTAEEKGAPWVTIEGYHEDIVVQSITRNDNGELFVYIGGYDQAEGNNGRLLKVSASGDVLWERRVMHANGSYLFNSELEYAQEDNTLYLMAQCTDSVFYGDDKFYSTGANSFVMKVNAENGALVWNKMLAGFDQERYLHVGNSGDLFMSARTKKGEFVRFEDQYFGQGSNDITWVLCRITKSGELLWNNWFNFRVDIRTGCISPNAEGNLMLYFIGSAYYQEEMLMNGVVQLEDGEEVCNHRSMTLEFKDDGNLIVTKSDDLWCDKNNGYIRYLQGDGHGGAWIGAVFYIDTIDFNGTQYYADNALENSNSFSLVMHIDRDFQVVVVDDIQGTFPSFFTTSGALDGAGNFILPTVIYDVVSFSNGESFTPQEKENFEFYVLSYSPEGTTNWIKHLPGIDHYARQFKYTTDMVVQPNGTFYITGALSGEMHTDQGVVESKSVSGILTKFVPAVLENILESEVDKQYRIYPNPTTDKLNIAWENKVDGAELSLLTLDGKVVLQEQIQEQQNTTLDLENYPAGVYMLSIQTGDQIHLEPIIKQD